MGNRSTKFAASVLAIVLGLTGVGAISKVTGQLILPVMAQAPPADELEKAIAEGTRLLKEGSKASLTAAIQQFEKVLQLSRTEEKKSQRALALFALGRIYSVFGEQPKALEYFSQTLLISRAVGDRLSEASTLNRIGLVYSNLGEKSKALEHFNQALLISRAVGNRAMEATILNNIGTVYSALGEKPKALEYYSQALPTWRAVGDRSSEAITLSSIGLVYSDLGEKQKALEYYNQALPILRAVGDRLSEARNLSNIGLIYSGLGQQQKALDYYNQSLPISHAVGDRAMEAITMSNIGAIYSRLGEKQKALEYYKQALLISRAVVDRAGEANTLSNIGLVYSDLGKKSTALEYYNQALSIRRAVGDRNGEATTLTNIGAVYSNLGKKPQALDYYNQALLIWRAVGNRNGEAVTFANISYLFNPQQPDVAIVFYKKSVNLYESLRQDIRKLPRETQEAYTSSVAKTYRSLADILLTQGRTQEAQSILELLKVQELRGYGKDQDTISSPVHFPLHPLESQVIQAFEKTIASKNLTLETLNTIAEPLTQNRDRITQEMNNMPIEIGNPQDVLKANPNALLIQNLVVGDKLWVLWTNASGNTKAIVVPNVTQKQLNETVKTFRDQIGSPYSNLNDLKATSTKLYNWLIPPELQTDLKNNPKQQLIFSLDHVTRYIPVAALYDGKDYLAQRYTLSNLITMDSDMADQLSPNGQSPSILALGTTKAYPGFSALPNVSAELEAIVKTNQPERGIYPGTIQLNQAFTAKSLTENLNAYRVLHIATHGSFNPKSITASYLLLGDGNRLPITDIAALNNLNTTHLVVLSACETGLSGAGQDGTEISGISGYFLRRGAKSVLASLWSVNDASTALLMQQFYAHLSTGTATKAKALQKAQQDFISGKLTAKEAETIARAGGRPYAPGQTPPGSFAHPYFWAPFVLMGNNQ
jgi:CHAT domain-containing protein